MAEDTKKITRTFAELREIDVVYGKYLKEPSFEHTKLGYAFKRFSDTNLKKLFTEFNNALYDLRIDNALTDEKTGAILYQDETKQDFQMSKEGLRAFIKQSTKLNEAWEKKEFPVEPYICSDLGSVEFTEDEKELLKGLII